MSLTATIENVILVGGSGNVGSLLIAPLAAVFDLTLLTRSSIKTTLPDNVKVLQADYTLDGLTKAFKGQDVVVSAIGATGFADQKLMIDAAVAAGVKWFLPSEFSVNSSAPAVRELVPVFHAKQEVLDHLKSKESQLSWVGLAAGPLLDWGLKAGFLDFDIVNKKAKVWDDGRTRYSGITVHDLGRALVQVLKEPGRAELRNRYVFVRSVTTSQAEILAVLKELEPSWSSEKVTTEDQIEAAQKGLAVGDYAAAVKLVQASAFGNLPNMKQNFEADEKERLVNGLLDMPKRDIAAIVKEAMGAGA